MGFNTEVFDNAVIPSGLFEHASDFALSARCGLRRRDVDDAQALHFVQKPFECAAMRTTWFALHLEHDDR